MRFLVLAITFLWIGEIVHAQTSPQIKFDEANVLLEEGSYQQSMELYRRIEQQGAMSGPLFLNMGIAAVQMDSMGLGKYYFKKAANFETVQQRAHIALDFVNSQFSRQSAMLPKLPWDRAVDMLKVTPGTFGLFVTGYLFLCLALLFLIFKWFNIVNIPKHTNSTIACFTLSVLIISLAYYVDYVDRRYDEAVLIDEEVVVSENPQENATLISMAYEGYEVTIDHKISSGNNNWFYIRLGNGQYGWIKSKGIKIL